MPMAARLVCVPSWPTRPVRLPCLPVVEKAVRVPPKVQRLGPQPVPRARPVRPWVVEPPAPRQRQHPAQWQRQWLWRPRCLRVAPPIYWPAGYLNCPQLPPPAHCARACLPASPRCLLSNPRPWPCQKKPSFPKPGGNLCSNWWSPAPWKTWAPYLPIPSGFPNVWK